MTESKEINRIVLSAKIQNLGLFKQTHILEVKNECHRSAKFKWKRSCHINLYITSQPSTTCFYFLCFRLRLQLGNQIGGHRLIYAQ